MKKLRNARIALVCVILIITSLPLHANADLSAILLIDGENKVTAEEFSIAVLIEGEDMRGGAARLVYDPLQIRLVSVTPYESENVSVRHSEENGIVSFLFTTVDKTSGTLDLLNVTFAVIDGQEGEAVTLDLTDRSASDGEREVVPLFTTFTTVLASSMHTETPDVQTETTVPETTAPETTTEAPETEPETETQITETETEPAPDTETTAPDPPETKPDDTTGNVVPETDTDRNTTAVTTDPPLTETDAETGDDDGGDRRPVYLTVMIIAAALLLTGAAVFTVIYLIERHKNKMRNE